MARIRSIKPEFWSSPKVGKVSRDARLLFIGLWNEADDDGRLLGQTKRLAGIIFPFDDDVESKQDEQWLVELQLAGLVVRYSVGDAGYLSIPGFNDHQKIDKRTPSRLPPPPTIPAEQSESPADYSGEPADHVAEHSDQSESPADKLGLDLGEDLGSRRGSRIKERSVSAVPADPPETNPGSRWTIPERLDTPEVRALLDRFAKMRKRKKKPIDDFFDASLVLDRFDDVAHLVYSLETCIANGYQGLKPDYREPKPPGAGKPKTFGQQKVSNTDAAFQKMFGSEVANVAS